MRQAIAGIAAVLAGAAVIAGCGGTAVHHAAPTPAHSTAATAPAPTATHAPASASASANAQLFAYGLASDTVASVSSLRSSVAGPVMSHYLTYQSIRSEAAAAAGQPYPPGTVTRIPGGFQICADSSSGGVCQSLTGFRSDATGRITDLAVDGQLISARLAIGPNTSGSGLTLTGVTSYLNTTTGVVFIACTVRNISGQTVGSFSPPFLPVFVIPDGTQLNYDTTYSVLPGPLRPGESSPVIVEFDTRVITGHFSLRANDQTGQILVASTLRKG
jgi:hypothetical protein